MGPCVLLLFPFFPCLFRATPGAYGGSQARGLIGAVAADLHHSHAMPDLSCVCNLYHSLGQLCFVFFCLFFAISWAAPAAYGGSQARGLIRAIATGLRQSHSNVGSEPCLQPTPHSSRQCQILNPLIKARDGTPNLMVPSRIH